MSLIHQALKKLENADYPAAAKVYSFRKPGIKTLSPLLAPLIVLSIAAAYFAYPLTSKINGVGMTKPQAVARDAISEKAQAPVETSATPPGPNEQGIEEYRAGRFDKSEALFKKAANEKQAQAFVHSNLGVAAMRLEKKREAEVAFKKALKFEPENPLALNNYASLMAEAGKSGKAIMMLEKAIEADPSYADAHFNLAVILEKKGNLAGALARYEDFLRLAPSDIEASHVRKKLMALRSEIIVKQAGGR